ncbi:MAG: MATE family efflux transporter [Cyclobacteriaceae bacterium]|nr:MAG: MATE family efflux transporter [Cyclobacteriaceae bacterium]
MLSQLGQVLVGVADSLMVGQLGAQPLAAASLANVIFHVIMVFGLGVSLAVTPLVAAADGEQNIKKITGFFSNGLLVNIILGIVLALAVVVCTPILNNLDQPQPVVTLAIPYLRIITVALVPYMIFQSFRQFAEGMGNTRQAMYITLMGNALNIVLNYLFIYGKLGFPELGLNGAGWATLIARTVMALSMGGYIYYSSRFRVFRQGFSLIHISRPIIRRILKVGVPAGLQFVFEVSAFGFAAIMMGWLGTQTLAAHQIAINLASISYMMATGIASAATIRVGNQLGKGDLINLRTAGNTSIIMVVLFMGCAGLLFVMLRDFFPQLYISDPEVISIASQLLVVAAFFQISDGVQVVGMGALRGIEDVKVPTVIAVTAYWLVGLPVGYFLAFSFGMGANGIWYGLFIGLSLAAVLLYYRFRYKTAGMLSENVAR